VIIFNHCFEFYLEKGIFPKEFIQPLCQGIKEFTQNRLARSSIIQHRTNCLGPPNELLRANHDIFAWQHTTFLGTPKEFLQASRVSFAQRPLSYNASEGLRHHFLWANRDIIAWHHWTCLGLPKELITPREGPRHQFLRANCDVFACQHVNSHGPPKESTKATNKIYFSLAN
jgi:hypothetical protein